jgi:hypothetical protein
MNVPKKPQFTIEELGHNPNIPPLQIPVYEKISRVDFIKGDGGKLEQKAIVLESVPKVSLYITSQHRKLTSQLPTASKELFLWILYELDSNQDFIWVNKDRFMKECTVSYNTYKKAIDGLIRFIYLTPTVIHDVFWINPFYYFRGSRVNKYPDNLVFTNKQDEIIDEYINDNV